MNHKIVLSSWKDIFQQYDIFGNVFWYFESSSGLGGAPDRVYRLHPERVRVYPGSKRTIEKYGYVVQGKEFDLSPDEVVHFRKSNPLPRGDYYGLSAIDLLRNSIESDKKMVWWNREFFSSGAPSGIVIVDSGRGLG